MPIEGEIERTDEESLSPASLKIAEKTTNKQTKAYYTINAYIEGDTTRLCDENEWPQGAIAYSF